jgi:hypothetical protein
MENKIQDKYTLRIFILYFFKELGKEFKDMAVGKENKWGKYEHK